MKLAEKEEHQFGIDNIDKVSDHCATLVTKAFYKKQGRIDNLSICRTRLISNLFCLY